MPGVCVSCVGWSEEEEERVGVVCMKSWEWGGWGALVGVVVFAVGVAEEGVWCEKEKVGPEAEGRGALVVGLREQGVVVFEGVW